MTVLRATLSACFLFALSAVPTYALACSEGCLFQKVTVPGIQSEEAVAIGDVNNDGRRDIVAVGSTWPNGGLAVYVYLQGTDGALQPPLTYAFTPSDATLPTYPSVAIGDLNGDGRNDVVVTTNRGIRVLWQSPQGQLGSVQDYATAANRKIRLGDINKDGRLDVVSAARDNVSIFLQTAGGTLAAPQNSAVPTTGADLELGDFNNDGRLDVALVSTGSNEYHDIAVLLQSSAGSFLAPAYYDIPASPDFLDGIGAAYAIGAGDLNGDGRADLVVTDGDAPKSYVFLQNASGSFDPPVTYRTGDRSSSLPKAVDVVDVNQDGRADIVAVGDRGDIFVHLQNADGTLGISKLHGLGTTGTTLNQHNVAIGDINGDGKLDVAIAKYGYPYGVEVQRGTRADLRMTLAADQASGLVGKPIRYKATIVNDGPDAATNVRLAHVLPAGVFATNLINNSQGTCDDNKQTCTLGAMAAGQTATVTFEAYAYSQPGTYTSTVSLTEYPYDGDTSDNQLSVTVPIAASADLAIYSHAVSAPTAGQVSYTVAIQNSGNSDAQGVAVIDTLPSTVIPLSARWSELWGGTRSGSCSITGNDVRCDIGTLAVTDVFAARYPVAVFISGQVTTGDNLLNVASVSAETGDPKIENNRSARLSTAQGSAINQAPLIAFAGPNTVRLGAAAVLDARDTRDPEGAAVSFRWDFADGSQAWSGQARHVFTTAGSQAVTLSATDDKGAVSSQTFSITVVNTAPVVVLDSPYYFSPKNRQGYMDGSRSYDVDGGALSYYWSFGNGTTGAGPIGYPTYAQSGTYPASLMVSDGALSPVASVNVYVLNAKPIANAGARYDNAKNQPTNFDGSYSQDADGDALTYRWTFGDGTTGTGARPSHTYARGGIYTATLIVNDGEADSDPSAAQVTVTNHAPVAAGGGPYAGVKGQAIAFNGSTSSDADGDPLTYRWNFGDGTMGGGAQPTHVYTKSGRFTVQLVVNDGEVDSVVYQTTADVKNR